jgi:tetratricopeptide (TPR) repeat protein
LCWRHGRRWRRRLRAGRRSRGRQPPLRPPKGDDLAAIHKRFQDLYAARNYAAALAEAQKYEAAVKAQFGTSHPNHGLALNELANVYYSQGKYGEAEPLYKRALTIYENAGGVNQLNVATTLNNLGLVAQSERKYDEAEGFYKRSLAIREKALGESHPDVATTLHNLGLLARIENKRDEAERFYKRALAIREEALGESHPDVAQTLHNLAAVYQSQRKYGEAEGLYKRAVTIREKAFGENDRGVANSLGNLAQIYEAQGKYGEAEGLLKRALAIREKALGDSPPEVVMILSTLVRVYRLQGKYVDVEAEGLFKRALAIMEKAHGPDHPDVAFLLNYLAVFYHGRERYADAEPLYKRALAIQEKALGPDHPVVANSLNNLAALYRGHGRYPDAEELFQRALAIREKALGESAPQVAETLAGFALVYQSQGKYGEAEGLFQRALTIRENALGASHPALALSLNSLAILYNEVGNGENALSYSRKATQAVLAHAASEAGGAQQDPDSVGLVEQRAGFFRLHVANLAVAARKGIEPAAALAREALETAQWASHSSAAAALAQMSARVASGDGALAALVRDSQDLSAAWRDKDKRLLDALSKPDGQRDRAETETLRKEIADIERRSAAVAARLEKEFPDYAALASPKPLKPEDVQKLLGADEALVFFLTGDKESYVFVLSREAFDWKTIPVGAKDLSDKVAALRHGLDVGELTKSASAGKPELFDLGLAHELYAALLGPVEALVKDKRHLLIVPTGALTALPFHLLVTETPATPTPHAAPRHKRNIGMWRSAVRASVGGEAAHRCRNSFPLRLRHSRPHGNVEAHDARRRARHVGTQRRGPSRRRLHRRQRQRPVQSASFAAARRSGETRSDLQTSRRHGHRRRIRQDAVEEHGRPVCGREPARADREYRREVAGVAQCPLRDESRFNAFHNCKEPQHLHTAWQAGTRAIDAGFTEQAAPAPAEAGALARE